MSTVIEIQSPTREIYLYSRHTLYRDICLEFFGTLIFVYISLAGVNQSILTKANSQLEVALCFCLGLSAGIFVSQKSGAHLNPAVSATTYITTLDFNITRLITYTIAQLLGAFVAGLLVIAVYYSWMNEYPDSLFYGAFGTLKQSDNSLGASIIDQLIGSTFLMLGISIIQKRQANPLYIGVILGGLALFQGTNGFAFNPARDLGPRIASSIVLGKEVFTSQNHWFWVPLAIPYIGIFMGNLLSHLLD